MATLTLHRAGRIQEQIRASVRALRLEKATTISIFARNARDEIGRGRERLLERIDRLERLLAALGAIRATTGQANAEQGISALLAEKAQLQEWIALVDGLVADDARAKRGWPEPRRPSPPDTDIDEQIRAMRARFEAAEIGEGELKIDLLDEETRRSLGTRMTEKRRRLEEISDRLRQLNATAAIEVADELVTYLREHEVI